jgi:hypothetical protein
MISGVKWTASRPTACRAVITRPLRDGPCVVNFPWRQGRFGAERETAGASEGGGCLSRATGARSAFTGALGLGGAGGEGGLIQTRLT